MGRIWRICPRLLTGLALIAFAICFMVTPQLWDFRIEYKDMPALYDFGISGASILAFQIVWLVLEFSFERLAIPGIPKLTIRGILILCVVILLFLADENEFLRTATYGILMYDIQPGLCAALCICGMWVVLWPAINMVAGGIFSMFRRIL